MKGVDLQDQVTAFFPIMSHTVKVYRKIFYILDIFIFNAYVVIFSMAKRKKSYTDFWTAVARQLLEIVELPVYSIHGHPSSSSTATTATNKELGTFSHTHPNN
jgi:hypothetical protein